MSCYKYWDDIKEIADTLEKYGDNLDGIPLSETVPLLDKIEVIAHDELIDFDSAKHILEDDKMNKALKLVRKFYLNIGANLETENAKKILESDDPWETLESFHFYERYIGLIKNESQLVKFGPKHTVVFVGGGPLPLTLILINKLYGSKCISVEIKEDVAELSKKVLKKLDIEDITVVTGDETSVKDLDYNVLMVAALAEPKERIFGNLWNYIDTSIPVLFRTYTGMRAILYAPVTDSDTRGFHKEVMILPTGKTNNTSVLIRKVL